MATEALIDLVSFALTKVVQEANMFWRVGEQMEGLQRNLREMKRLLEEAGKKQEEDVRVHRWVSEIREAVYDAEDITDMCILNLRRYYLRRRFKDWRQVDAKIESLRAQLEAVPRRRDILRVGDYEKRTSSSHRMLLGSARQSSSLPVEEGHVSTVGLEEKEEKLLKVLFNGDRSRRVISVVGLGGIGKTTLAKKVYNHKKVVHDFGECRAWVYVSQDCKPREIYQKILDQVYTVPAAASIEEEADQKNIIKEIEEEQLGDFLRDKLEGKKYLVVLDDVWTCNDWDRLAKVSINETDSLGRVFPDSGNGSRLLVTSRDENVALHADARVTPLRMQFLSQEESWDLFCRKAFLEADPESYHPSLLRLGKTMVNKCKGLPLAIVVLGGLLSRNISLPEWRKVLDNMDAYLAELDQPVLDILKLSYVSLPSHLKLCFLHLGLFPEDHVISTRKLLSLWIAEGFVRNQPNQRRLKDTANDYLNQLISRNLVQVVRMSVNKRVMECRVHELVRKLAIETAREENFISDGMPPSYLSPSSTKFRWQSIHSDFDFERYASTPHSTPCLRTLIFSKLHCAPTSGLILSNMRFIYKCFERLRVLDLEGLQITNLPSKIGELIFLRYLGLRNTSLKTLPSSLKDLGVLQTLDTNNLIKVPKEICQIKNLRDLYMDGQAEPTLIRVDKLKKLQNLSGIRFDQWIYINESKLTCLEKLKLEGRFKMDGANLSKSISQLHKLRSLHLKASDGSVSIPPLVMKNWPQLFKLDITGPMQKLPEANEFPPCLTQLTLEATELHDDPMPVLEQLPELLTLRLRANSYTGHKMQVSPKGFGKLNVLQISELTRLTKLNIESGAMPWLTELQFDEKLHISKLSQLQNLVEVDIICHIHDEIPYHVLLQNGDWKYTPRTYRNNAEGFHLYREQGQTSASPSELIEKLVVFLEQVQKT